MTDLTATIDRDVSEAMKILADKVNPALVVHESMYRVEIEANGDIGIPSVTQFKQGYRKYETFRAVGFSRAYYVAKDFLKENTDRDGFNTWRIVALQEIAK